MLKKLFSYNNVNFFLNFVVLSFPLLLKEERKITFQLGKQKWAIIHFVFM